MKSLIRFILLMSFGTLAVQVNAQQPTENYRVEVAVANQSEAERIKATKSGFATLIQRIVNDPVALQTPDVSQAIELAPNYLTQFNYTPESNIVLQFSSVAVVKLLQKAQLVKSGQTDMAQLVIHVVNVQDFASFKQIQSYLKNLSSVQKVQLLVVDKTDIQIGLTLKKDQSVFESALAAGNKLQPATGEKILPFSYVWRP